jgi:pseudaminic acid synthase
VTLTIQKASSFDILNTFNLSNDPVVRQSSFSSDPILFHKHEKWFNEILDNKSVLFFVIYDGDALVSQIRYKKTTDRSCEISISITDKYRGKHVASQCLSLSVHELKKEWDCNSIIAEVKEENSASNNFFLKNDFYLVKKYLKNGNSVCVYERYISNNKTIIIAELSANHGQKLSIALETIKAAKEAGADAVKIQTYTPDTITIDCDNEYFQIKQGTLWDGTILYDLYKSAYTPWEWHKQLFDYANEIGIPIFSTPFDNTAVDFLEQLNNPIYKIASFELNDIPLIEYAASKGKPMILSTGVANIGEIQDAVNACHRKGNYDITLLKCTSSYPAPVEAANLLTIPNMAETFGVKVGLSDHTMGSVVPVAAVALGAIVIEKHFIIDRDIGGPDASFSMIPSEFKELVSKIRIVEKALGKIEYNLDEKSQANTHFKRSLFITEDIKAGEIFTKNNIRSIRPGVGESPVEIIKFIGKKAIRDIARGTPANLNMVVDFSI